MLGDSKVQVTIYCVLGVVRKGRVFSHFSVPVIKYHSRGDLKKKFIWAYGSSWYG